MSSNSMLLVALTSSLAVVAVCVIILAVYFCYKSRRKSTSSSDTTSDVGTSSFNPDIKFRSSTSRSDEDIFARRSSMPFRSCPSVTTLESNRFDDFGSEYDGDGEVEAEGQSSIADAQFDVDDGESTIPDNEMMAMQRALKIRLEQKRQSRRSFDTQLHPRSETSLQPYNMALESQGTLLY